MVFAAVSGSVSATIFEAELGALLAEARGHPAADGAVRGLLCHCLGNGSLGFQTGADTVPGLDGAYDYGL